MNLIEELKWRGLLQDIVPETEDYLLNNKAKGYIGFDPTSDSLHVGSLIQIILLKHLQAAGHQPIALLGGATGRVGDPSGKSEERSLLTIEEIDQNVLGIKGQLDKFLDFEGNSGVILENNIDWFKDFHFLDFIRDVGKHITVNYMLSKESVKKRVESDQGISFTEFTYQLIQGYDFLKLFEKHGCLLQMGGSDQWGNMTTGIELIRRIRGEKAYAITTPLTTKSDGGKFGKSESGNVWLDPKKTSPYQFYQFWINTPDEDAKSHIKKYTFLTKDEIERIISEHDEDPGKRELQKRLAAEVTAAVHDDAALDAAKEASEILFGNSNKDEFLSISKSTLDSIYQDVPNSIISKEAISGAVGIIDLLADHTGLVSSKSEARRALKENSVSVNKEKVQETFQVGAQQVIKDEYIVLQRGKKKYHLIKVSD